MKIKQLFFKRLSTRCNFGQNRNQTETLIFEPQKLIETDFSIGLYFDIETINLI